jgi:hypothetical protein
MFILRARSSASFAAGVALTMLLAVAIPAWALDCNNCVNSGDLVNGAVHTSDIDGAAVTTGKLATGAVRARTIGALPAVRVFNAGNQAVPTGQDTALSFNTEHFDTASMHSASNPTRLTIPRTGLYDVGYSFAIDNSDSDSYRQVTIRANLSVYVWLDRVAPVAGALFLSPQGSTIYRFTAGDYIELYVTQLSGSSLDVYGDAGTDGYYPAFWARWVGP